MFAYYFRVFDSLNYVDNLKFGIDSVRKAGGVAEATLCYTGGLDWGERGGPFLRS